MSAAALVWCPFPDEAAARTAVSLLLDERLIACANLVPGMTSLFAWQGAREEAGECGVLMKTTAVRQDAAIARLAAVHPYDAPAILGWTVAADARTLSWLERETGSC